MSLHETEDIVQLTQMIKGDLFDRISIHLSRLIADTDAKHEIKMPLLPKESLTSLLAKVYLYFLHPVTHNRYQHYAYDFFDLRLRRAKELNPLKNVYQYGVEVITTFLAYVEELELFFRNMVDFYMEYLTEIKALKRVSFNEKAMFKSIIVGFLHPDQRYSAI